MKNSCIYFSLIFFLVIFISCHDSNEPSDRELFSNYITNYSSSPTSRCNDIYVDLGFTVKNDVKISSDLLKIKPNIGGQVVLNESRNRVILKGTQIKHNQRYMAYLNIGALTKMPSELREFRFEIEAKRQSWDIIMDAPTSISMENVKLTGFIKTAVCEPDYNIFYDALTASQDGKKLNIELFNIESNKDRNGTRFGVKGVKRHEKAGKVILNLSMEPINVSDKAKLEILIPSKSDFSFHSFKINNNNSVTVYFTDPIKKEANVDGLIQVKGRKIKQTKIVNNSIIVFFANREYGKYILNVNPGIKNIASYKLKDGTQRDLFFAPPAPSVEITEDGNILPPTGHWDLPVSLISASGFRMRILKVYPKNAHRFYQENNASLKIQRGLENIGKVVFDSIFVVNKPNAFAKTFHAIKLDGQVNKEAGALYKVFLSIPHEHNKYPKESIKRTTRKDEIDAIDFDNPSVRFHYGYNDYYGDSYAFNLLGNRSYRDLTKKQKSNGNYMPSPESVDFENYIHDQRLLICSDIGLVFKSEPSRKRYLGYVSHITSAKPINGAKVELQNFQGKIIGSGYSDASGFVSVKTNEKPFLVKANFNSQYTYLPVSDAKAISMSTFQVEGKESGNKNNVFFYGDRNVWRPGDSIYMNAIVFQKEGKIPSKLPINLTLYNATNKLMKKWVVKNNVNGLYNCRFNTTESDQTGNWRLELKLGGVTHTSTIRVETIKPNRLKIDLQFADKIMLTDNLFAPIEVKWMHGLEAVGLKSEVTMLQKSLKNPFGADYANYTFDDIKKNYQNELGVVKSDLTKEAGLIDFEVPVQAKESYPSMMLFNFEIRAFEKSGAFSTDMKTVKYSPYISYTGLKFPQGNTNQNIYINDNDAIQIACLDQEGRPIKEDVTISLTKVNYRWWYQYGQQGDYAAINSNIGDEVQNYVKTIPKSGASISIKQRGHFILNIKNNSSGHSVSRIIYCYTGDFYTSENDEVEQLEVLPFLIDKNKYEVGDIMDFDLPAFKNGQYVITVESGGEILYKESKPSKNTPTKVLISITDKMTPTAYVHVHFIQGWLKHDNDRPLRLFGVKPFSVFDHQTVLKPHINMKKDVRADKEFSITVSEINSKPMTYTLAVVDEGLLDITQFKTPKPWNQFFEKERLMTKTWDMYRDVFQKFLGEYNSLLAIGGDGANSISASSKAQRFKPVVKFLGPFTMEAGQTKMHKLTIEDYVGSVRVMVVATNGHAFGHTEETVLVTKPLMIYTTMPRVLGPGENLKVPVTVFAMKPEVKNVEVSMTTNDLIDINGKKLKNISFQKVGEKDMFFDIKIPEKIGVGNLTIIAKSGGYIAKETIEIDVRASSPLISKTIHKMIPANKQESIKFESFGIPSSKKVSLSMSKGLNFSFEPFVNRLSNYPHGCLEQTVSSVFPQMFLYKMNLLDPSALMSFRQKYKAAIQRLRYMQTPNGGFSYWPGGNVVNNYATSYALDFLIEAKKLGYEVPSDMLKKLINYQYDSSNDNPVNSRNSNRHYRDSRSMAQAYKLYTLAKAGKPNYAAMNRLRLVPQLGNTAKWILGDALMKVGENSSADQLIQSAEASTDQYREYSGSFGSEIRDQAFIIRILLDRGEKLDAKRLIDELVPYFNEESNKYLTTQEISQCLISFAQFSGEIDNVEDSIAFDLSLSASQEYSNVQLTKDPITYVLNDESINKGDCIIENKGANEIFSSLTLTGRPVRDASPAEEQDLKMEIKYLQDGGASLNPRRIKKGSDFIIEISISHAGHLMDFENMALTTIFPSGWELINHRLNNTFGFNAGSAFDYQDIRDDSAFTYFDLIKSDKVVYRFKLNASYEGKYWMPSVFCEAMYNPSVRSKSAGFWTEVY